jgi:subtilisin
VQGYPDGTYRPNAELTRGQAAKIIANSAGWDDIIPADQQTFNDVPTGSTFWVYIERAYQHGAIGGYPCGGVGEPCPGIYYRPGNTVTRGQTAKVASIAAGYDDAIPPTQQTFTDVLPGSTFWVYIERVALHGVVNGYGDGTFGPENPVTRGQIAKIAALAFFPGCSTPER